MNAEQEKIISEGENSIVYAQFEYRLGKESRDDGKYEEAYSYFKSAYRKFLTFLGKEHPTTLKVQKYLASVASYPLEKKLEAMELRKDLLETYRKNPQENMETILVLLQDIAETCNLLHLIEKELPYREEYASLTRKVYGGRDYRTIDAMIDVRTTLYNLERENEAKAMEKEILSIGQQIVQEWQISPPQDEEEIDQLIHVVDSTIRQTGDDLREEAEKLEDELLELCIKSYGDDRWNVLRRMEDMAIRRKGERAVALYEAILSIYQQDGDASEDSIQAKDDLRRAYEKAGHPEEAARLQEEIRKIRWGIIEKLRGSRGEEVEEILDSLEQESDQLHALGELDAAIECRKRAVEICRREFGEQDEKTLSALDQLSDEYSAKGEDDEAISIDMGVLKTRQKMLESAKEEGCSPSEISRLLRNVQYDRDTIACNLGSLGRREEELALRLDILTDASTAYSLPDMFDAATEVATVYREMGRFEDAVRIRKAAVAMCRSRHGMEASHFLWWTRWLASDLEMAGNYEEAAKSWLWVADISEKNYGAAYAVAMMARHKAVHALVLGGKWEEALDIAGETVEKCCRKDTVAGKRVLEGAKEILDICTVLHGTRISADIRGKELHTKAVELLNEMTAEWETEALTFQQPERVADLMKDFSEEQI